MALYKGLAGALWSALRWVAGCEPAAHAPTHDTLEPYVTEAVLQQREAGWDLGPGEARAIARIGARYGAEL